MRDPLIDPLVAIDRVGKSFGATRVLRDVTLNVGKGEVVTLIGPSGCGKTTLLRCVNFLETYDEGVVTIAGETVGIRLGPDGGRKVRPDREIAAMRARVGMVFQGYNLFPHLTVLENLTVAPVRVRGLPIAGAREKAMTLLDRVGLSDKAAQYPAALSGGQQQRVAIARTLAMEPSLILLDEVTSALDPELVGEVLEVIQSLATDGMTMMIVTHEMQFAREVSSRVAFMADGEILELAPPEDLFGNPRSERLRAFLSRFRAAHRI
jgi:polar amino acid transport system ATP-binding protein